MPSKEKNVIRLSGYINPKNEPKLAESIEKLSEMYSISAMTKEGLRCLAKREGLMSNNDSNSIPA